VREALCTLENMGAVESRQGSGTYLSGHMSHGISRLMSMMMVLDRVEQGDISAFRRSMEKATCLCIIHSGCGAEPLEKAAALLERWPAVERETLTGEELARIVEADKTFHYLLIHATENRFLIMFMEAVEDLYQEWISAMQKVATAAERSAVAQAHREMLAALLARDEAACLRAIDRHYDIIDEGLKHAEQRGVDLQWRTNVLTD
jgi:GntR family transcriptional repressor for pyruvate dehydrogenase complex